MSWAPGAPVRLETPGYTIRSLTPEDVGPHYVGWLRDPEVTHFLNSRFQPVSEDSLRRFVSGHDDRTGFLLGIFDRTCDRHVGNYRASCDLDHRRADQGVLIGERDLWGKGVVLETRPALLDFLFGPVGMRKVCGSVYARNAAAIFNYKKQGFVAEGILRSHVVCDGERCDVIQFAMFAEEWRERRSDGA